MKLYIRSLGAADAGEARAVFPYFRLFHGAPFAFLKPSLLRLLQKVSLTLTFHH